jgi:hypothetical protein
MAGHNTLTDNLADAAGGSGALATVALGTLVAGTLDISAAIITWLVQGVSATRVLQSVAGGLLGRVTFNGGAATAVLGLLLHFLIMSVIVTVFYVASRRLPVLTRHWFWCGVPNPAPPDHVITVVVGALLA